ncbi:MAG: hypothetical protein Q4B04_03585, partial [bacterium]|nr:hypothetical protein [bacterium]
MKAKKMQTKRVIRQVFCMLLSVALLCVQFSVLPINNAVADTAGTSINFDPNDGMITYGHTGTVGARAELETDNFSIPSARPRINFPADVIKYFDDYDENNPYYDYGPMFNKALELARGCKGKIFCDEGVFYFATPIYLWGYHYEVTGVYGKTIFVAEPYFYEVDGVTPVDVNGFMTNKNLSDTYAWNESFGMSDLTFVAAGAHKTFKPTSTAEEIMANIFSDDIQPVKNFCGMYRIVTKYAGLNNLTFSGFDAHMSWVRLDMLTRTQNCSFGPSRVAIKGSDTNDAFINDCYFYGGYYTDDLGYARLPVLFKAFNLATTYITNCYMENYIYSDSTVCWAPYSTVSNCTMVRVHNIVIYSTSSTSSSLSGCLIKDCAYNDFVEYFESQGLEAYDHSKRYFDSNTNTYVYMDGGYMILNPGLEDRTRIEANYYNGIPICVFTFYQGSAVSQNKIICDDMEKTCIVRIFDESYMESNYKRNHTNFLFTDNAFEIGRVTKDQLLYDGISKYKVAGNNNWISRDNNVFAEGWEDHIAVGHWVKENGSWGLDCTRAEEPVCWLDNGVYISTQLNRYLDFSAFVDPNAKTVGYKKPVGTDESKLLYLEKAYYNDLKNGVEVVNLTDFGAQNKLVQTNAFALQRAFDYCATYGSILYIEPGTFYTDSPIVLRGGKTYRVVFDGEIRAMQSDSLTDKGVFVMSADDNRPMNGYFYGLSASLISSETSLFYNVNFDKMLISVNEINHGVGMFTNCNITNSILCQGHASYFDKGIFFRSTLRDCVIKSMYYTGSTWEDTEINDTTYRCFIGESDLIDCVFRGNWLEFGQFSDGKKLTGEGNTVYRGNVIDYTYNYSFGRDDVFVGNTMTRASWGAIVGHMTGSEFPIDTPDELANKGYMTLVHMNDGLKVIGNCACGTMNEATHFIDFDSPTISYENEDGEIVKSISNARVAGNIAFTVHEGDWKVRLPYVSFDRTDNIVLENCQNNQLPMQLFRLVDQGGEYPLDFSIESVGEWAIPGASVIIYDDQNGELVKTPHTYTIDEFVEAGQAESAEPQNLVPVPGNTYTQDDIWDVKNYYSSDAAQTEIIHYDFMNADQQELQDLKDTFANKIDIVKTHQNSQYQSPVYGIAEDIDGYNSFHIDSTWVSNAQGNSLKNTIKPAYSLIFDECGDDLVGAKMSLWQDITRTKTWSDTRPVVIIYGEDENNYYGKFFQADVTRTATNHIYTNDVEIAKDGSGDGWGIGISSSSTAVKVDMIEPATGIYSNEKVLADYTGEHMFPTDDVRPDTQIVGMDIELKYHPDYNCAQIMLKTDWRYRGTDNRVDPPAITTTRYINLGTISMNNKKPVLGYTSGWEAWIESVELEYITDSPSQC